MARRAGIYLEKFRAVRERHSRSGSQLFRPAMPIKHKHFALSGV